MVTKKRKTVDSWKKKEWYSIVAPKSFEEKEIGNTPADVDKKLINRIILVPLRELTNNISHQFIKLMFRINEVKGKTAYTELEGFELVREYLQRNVQRRRTLIKVVKEIQTKDNKKAKITAYTFTARKADTSKKDQIRKIMSDEIERESKEETYDSFVQKCIFGKISGEIFRKVKTIYPIRRVEIVKSKLVRGK